MVKLQEIFPLISAITSITQHCFGKPGQCNVIGGRKREEEFLFEDYMFVGFDHPTGCKKNIQNPTNFPYISDNYSKCDKEVIYNRNNKTNKTKYLVINFMRNM